MIGKISRNVKALTFFMVFLNSGYLSAETYSPQENISPYFLFYPTRASTNITEEIERIYREGYRPRERTRLINNGHTRPILAQPLPRRLIGSEVNSSYHYLLSVIEPNLRSNQVTQSIRNIQTGVLILIVPNSRWWAVSFSSQAVLNNPPRPLTLDEAQSLRALSTQEGDVFPGPIFTTRPILGSDIPLGVPIRNGAIDTEYLYRMGINPAYSHDGTTAMAVAPTDQVLPIEPLSQRRSVLPMIGALLSACVSSRGVNFENLDCGEVLVPTEEMPRGRGITTLDNITHDEL